MSISALRFQVQIHRSTPLRDGDLLLLLEDCKRSMGIKKNLPTLELPQIASPAICGLWRPRLLFPCGFSKSLSSTQMRHVLLHELAHLKRADVQVNWIMTGIHLLHWCNPVVWWIMSRIRRDRELACDAMVLSWSGEDKKAYGQTIIHLLGNMSRPAVCPGVIGILEDKSGIQQRIRRIARFNPGRRPCPSKRGGFLYLKRLVEAKDFSTFHYRKRTISTCFPSDFSGFVSSRRATSLLN